MMNKIQLLKEPGYIFDLLFVFFLKYNKECCMDNFIDPKKEKEDTEYYEQVIKNFDPISDELYVFFHALKNKQCFMTLNYFYRFKNAFSTNYNIFVIQDALSDYSDVVKRVITYYFYQLSAEEVEKCAQSNVQLFKVIKQSDYSDTEKSRLYEFFAEPVWYIQKLQYELMEKEVQLRTFYEKNYSRILEAYSNLTIDVLTEQLTPVKDLSALKNCEDQLQTSFCLINKNCVNFVSVENGVVLVMGVEYINGVQAIQNKVATVKIDEFGSSLAEENRVKMLDLMLEKGEITCKDLERIFNFSGSTAYHHLTILLKNGVIKTRNEGKTILYSVNSKCFDVAIDILSKYSSGGKGIKS